MFFLSQSQTLLSTLPFCLPPPWLECNGNDSITYRWGGKCSVKWQVKVSWHKWGRLSYDSAFSYLDSNMANSSWCVFLSPHGFLDFFCFWQIYKSCSINMDHLYWCHRAVAEFMCFSILIHSHSKGTVGVIAFRNLFSLFRCNQPATSMWPIWHMNVCMQTTELQKFRICHQHVRSCGG